MGEIKIQLCATIRFINNDSSETKDCAISTKAQLYESNETITDGEDRIKDKIENYNESGSGWRILKILNYFENVFLIGLRRRGLFRPFHP